MKLLKILREMLQKEYPKQYLDALDTAINTLTEEYEYRDEMRI